MMILSIIPPHLLSVSVKGSVLTWRIRWILIRNFLKNLRCSEECWQPFIFVVLKAYIRTDTGEALEYKCTQPGNISSHFVVLDRPEDKTSFCKHPAAFLSEAYVRRRFVTTDIKCRPEVTEGFMHNSLHAMPRKRGNFWSRSEHQTYLSGQLGASQYPPAPPRVQHGVRYYVHSKPAPRTRAAV